jgi:hypothetical protein
MTRLHSSLAAALLTAAIVTSACGSSEKKKSSTTTMKPTTLPSSATTTRVTPETLGRWVALGDSYSSGEGSGGPRNQNFDPDTNAVDERGYIGHRSHRPLRYEFVNTNYKFNACRRSRYVYSRLLDDPGSSLHHERLELVHRACSGALIENVAATDPAENQRQGHKISVDSDRADPLGVDCTLRMSAVCTTFRFDYQDYQITSVTPETKLITISIGGNDIGFGDIVAGCVVAYLKHDHGVISRFGRWLHVIPKNIAAYLASDASASCQTAIAALEPRLDVEARIDVLLSRLRSLYLALLEAAPHSTLLVVGYPNVVADDPTQRTSPGRCPVLPADRSWVANIVRRLNGRVEAAVDTVATDEYGRGRIQFVDESHAFDGHELCGAGASDRRVEMYENGLVDIRNALWAKADETHDTSGNNSFHPTIAGYRSMARPVMTAIDEFVVSPAE